MGRAHPVVHNVEYPQLCSECDVNEEQRELDMTCSDCSNNLDNASIGAVFSVMRQWDTATQQHMTDLVNLVLRKGAHVEDKDSVTDNTLLHFAIKSAGLVRDDQPEQLVSKLIQKGADVKSRCGWTDMTPIHYASFFGSAPLIRCLKDAGADVNPVCQEFEGATPLHLAALTGSKDAVEALLDAGADATLRDDHGRIPLNCAKLIASSDNTEVPVESWNAIISMLTDAARNQSIGKDDNFSTHSGRSTPKRSMERFGATTTAHSPFTPSRLREGSSMSKPLEEGDRVLLSGSRIGTVRFVGPVEFKPGHWIGVELDNASGKNDGSVEGIKYFKCKEGHGAFVLSSKAIQLGQGTASTGFHTPLSSTKKVVRRSGGTRSVTTHTLNHDGTEITRTFTSHRSPRHSTPSSKPATPSKLPRSPAVTSSPYDQHLYSTNDPKLKEGSKVMVNGLLAHVRYVGRTEFAEGTWIGVEFDDPVGKNDGSVAGRAYFTCPANCGLFVKPSKASWHGISCQNMV